MPRTLPRPDADLSPQATDLKALGRLIRDRRGQAELRIDHAASLLGVSKSVLSRLENGESVSLDKLFKVLEGLGLTLFVFDHQAARLARLAHQKHRESDDAAAGLNKITGKLK